MFAGKRIVIWGAGREGQAAKTFLEKQGCEPVLIEGKTIDLTGVDIIIKSPGISLYNPCIQQALKQGIQVLSGTNLFMSQLDKSTKTIAITGTKGKSTTASLLAHVLKCKGYLVGFGGNIGVPLLELPLQKYDFLVAELSSYQCADLAYSFDISVLLNLYPEHIDWHGSHDKYYQDKLNLLRIRQPGQIGIINAQNEESVRRTCAMNNLLYFNDPNGFHVQNMCVMDGQTLVFSADDIPNIKGEHNLQNICAVLTALKALHLDFTDIAKDIASFKPLPHRLQTVACVDGVTFVDDSISTTPQTAVAALKAFDKASHIYLIVGGYDRQQDYTELLDYVALNQAQITLITLPLTGMRIAQSAMQRNIHALMANSVAEAVDLAQRQARAGDVVLLSPAAPSYHAYKNFEARGDDFSAHIKH